MKAEITDAEEILRRKEARGLHVSTMARIAVYASGGRSGESSFTRWHGREIGDTGVNAPTRMT
ncbi:MAG: hypothetical protein JXA20_07830 [Spirochaetes bacterium]|nr:hypothetical protein [Spirochaetota bacterium]